MLKNQEDSAEIIALFCRLHMNAKKNIPIRSSEMGLLIYLSRQKEAVTPLEAAEFLKVSKPMITKTVNRLEKFGYIEKLPSEKDKRSVTLTPTEKAEELVNSTQTDYYKHLLRLQEKMGETTFNELVALLKKANGILLEAVENA